MKLHHLAASLALASFAALAAPATARATEIDVTQSHYQVPGGADVCGGVFLGNQLSLWVSTLTNGTFVVNGTSATGAFNLNALLTPTSTGYTLAANPKPSEYSFGTPPKPNIFDEDELGTVTALTLTRTTSGFTGEACLLETVHYFTPDYFNVNEMLHFTFTLRATDQPNCYDLSGKVVNGGCPIVPEPTTLSLLGLGGLLAAWRRRK